MQAHLIVITLGMGIRFNNRISQRGHSWRNKTWRLPQKEKINTNINRPNVFVYPQVNSRELSNL